MTQRVFHGEITPGDLADALVGEFSNDEFNANQSGDGDKIVVQIFKPQWRQSGGNTSLGLSIQQHEDGVLVDMGDQEFLGVLASLGTTAFSVFQNPLNILGRLDDIAEDEAWTDRYGTRIPVLRRLADGRELGWPFDLAALHRFIHQT